MKGKLKALLLGLLCVLLTTGCVKHNVTMEVKDDKSVTLEMLYGMEIDTSMFDDEDSESDKDDDYDDEDDGGVDPEDYKFLEKAGYKVEPFSEETEDGTTLSGVKITKTFKNIDDITAEKEDKINLVSAFDEENKDLNDLKFFYKDGNKYAANFYFDYEADDETASQMDSMFDLKYTLKLSSKATENNASEVSEDGKVYTWNLKYSKKNDIVVKFNAGSSSTLSSSNTLYIAIGAAAVVVVGVVIAVVVLKKKNKAQDAYTASQEQISGKSE